VKRPGRELLAVPILVGAGALVVGLPNVASAGTLRDGSRVDITLQAGGNQAVGRIVADGLEPGDPVETSVISLTQNLYGKSEVRLKLTNLVSSDGSCLHGELVYDPTCGPKDKGELADMLRVRVQPARLDEQGDCVYDSTALPITGLDDVPLTVAMDKDFIVADLAKGGSTCVAFSWWFPMGGREDSASMTDIATFDIAVGAEDRSGGGPGNPPGGGQPGEGQVPEPPSNPVPPQQPGTSGNDGTGGGTGTGVKGDQFEQGGKTPDVRVFPEQPGLAATGANETWLVLAIGGLLISAGLVLKAVVGRRRTP
jgi:hypothetical protein